MILWTISKQLVALMHLLVRDNNFSYALFFNTTLTCITLMCFKLCIQFIWLTTRKALFKDVFYNLAFLFVCCFFFSFTNKNKLLYYNSTCITFNVILVSSDTLASIPHQTQKLNMVNIWNTGIIDNMSDWKSSTWM